MPRVGSKERKSAVDKPAWKAPSVHPSPTDVHFQPSHAEPVRLARSKKERTAVKPAASQKLPVSRKSQGGYTQKKVAKSEFVPNPVRGKSKDAPPPPKSRRQLYAGELGELDTKDQSKDG